MPSAFEVKDILQDCSDYFFYFKQIEKKGRLGHGWRGLVSSNARFCEVKQKKGEGKV